MSLIDDIPLVSIISLSYVTNFSCSRPRLSTNGPEEPSTAQTTPQKWIILHLLSPPVRRYLAPSSIEYPGLVLSNNTCLALRCLGHLLLDR